jgi:hypothetical protein
MEQPETDLIHVTGFKRNANSPAKGVARDGQDGFSEEEHQNENN